MKILQLCCFTNLWPDRHDVTSIDLRLGRNVLDLPHNFGKRFDIVCAAPPCDQYTKANSHNWVISPDYFNSVTFQCLQICLHTGSLWFLENPPGRIETFFPVLKQFRIVTWSGSVTKKEYVIYGNFPVLLPGSKRYTGYRSNSNLSKRQREMWQPDFIQDICNSLML